MTENANNYASGIKHIFVMNPQAGSKDSSNELKQKLSRFDGKLDYEIYTTKWPGDATRYVKERCEQNPEGGKRLRFYACGGDGTICEVVSGLVGQANAEMSCYACGSGNDYIRYYGTKEDFMDPERLINGIPHQVDLMEVEGKDPSNKNVQHRYSLNVADVGLDSVVCRTMYDVKRMPIIGGKRAYTTGVVKAIFCGRRHKIEVDVDGAPLLHGQLLLGTFANGQYVGGGYKCAPRSKNDDGLIEVCLISFLSFLRFLMVIRPYRQGRHFDFWMLKNRIRYAQGKVIEIRSPQVSWLTIDGEQIAGTYFKITQMEKAVTFVSPSM